MPNPDEILTITYTVCETPAVYPVTVPTSYFKLASSGSVETLWDTTYMQGLINHSCNSTSNAPFTYNVKMVIERV